MRPVSARRDVLKALSGALGLILAPTTVRAQVGGGSCPVPALTPPQVNEPAVVVSIHEPNREHLDLSTSATVSLQRMDAVGIKTELKRLPGRFTYEGKVERGRYRILVNVAGYPVFSDTVNVVAGGLVVPVYLGKAGWPGFRFGPSVYKFEPKEDVVGLAFDERPSDARREALRKQLQGLGLVPQNFDGSSKQAKTNWAASNSIALFRTSDPRRKIFSSTPSDSSQAGLANRLSVLLGKEGVRIGMPIDLRPGRVKLLDNRYVVQFVPKTPRAAVESLARRTGALLSPIEALPDSWLFTFGAAGNYRQHLRLIESLSDDSRVRFAEPSLILELQPHGGTEESTGQVCRVSSAGPATDDPWSACQRNLILQGVPEAWCFLEQQFGSDKKHGNADVCIATVDVGINAGHEDVDTTLLSFVNLCVSCADTPTDDDPHGMGVFGIISAKTGNGVGPSGIASGATHLAVMLKRNWVDPPWYAQLLLWLSGIESPSNFQALPNDRGADIINLSHGIEDIAIPFAVATALARLSGEGRKMAGMPLGTVVVCSAGNWSTDITGTQVVAADPNVIAVGNTLPPDAMGEERLWPLSNFGSRLDLCAQGQDAPSLLANPAQTLVTSCDPEAPRPGAYSFGGTSAAAPMVAATIALMLSVKKELTLQQVRGVLWQSAKCVDGANGQWVGHRSPLYGSGRLDVFGAVTLAAAT